MKRNFILVFATLLLLTGCVAPRTMTTGTAPATPAQPVSGSSTSQSSSLLGNLLSGLLGGNKEISNRTLAGTWQFTGTDCVFESENFLLKAGGEVAAASIESKLNEVLAKVGIKAGSYSYTFHEEGSYTAQIGSRVMNGTYQLDATNQTITMTYLAGLGQMTSRIVKNGDKISLLYESDKMLKLATTLSTLTGGQTGSTLSSLLSSYDGMYIGLELQKQ
jgi:hypothetical protein